MVWSGPAAPAIDRVLGFDPDDGAVAVIDSQGRPQRIDMRAAAVRLASRTKLTALASANGSEIFGISEDGNVIRLSPEGDWTFEPPSPARWVFPQPNGAVVIAGNQGSETHLWLIRPTGEDILENATVPLISRGVRTQVGDRLYFTVDSGLIGVLTRDLSSVKSVGLEAPVRAVVATPSGDRLYAALRGTNEIAVIDRYAEDVTATVRLPGEAGELRMDPLGQLLLAHPAAGGDSAWVIAISTNRVAGTIRSAWRNDLPAFAPAGRIAVVRGNDVVLVDTPDLEDAASVPGGARDFWYFFAWNGFRPRAAELDRPVTFDSPAAPVTIGDSGRLEGDSMIPPTVRDAAPSMITPPPAAPRARGYLVSFAAVLSEQRAGEVAAEISVNGVRPRIVPAQSGATTIYRVVLGPYATREEADRVGRDSRRQYWVFEEQQ